MSNILVNKTMYITKSSLSNGLMKWSAVNSDIDPDLYGEQMTIELYQKMLSNIRQELPPPDYFKSMVCSDWWCGGMPYLSLSHYPDLNGTAVPGEPLELYIDGKQLKAKGILYDNRLGKAVWKSLKEDENLSDDDKIRISIAFLDLAHKHGEDGEIFHRNSANAVCLDCMKGKGNKIYLDGYLVHLALTRRPVNPRTIIEEDAMARKSQITTRKEDALSIVGDPELVEQIDKSALETKSDVLVEMSDVPVVEEAKTEKKPMDEEEEMDDEEEEKDSSKGKKKCSLTEGDVETIRSLIVELLPKPVEAVLEVKSDTVSEKSALDLATDDLYNSVNVAMSLQGVTLEERLESINPSLQALGNSITAMVRESLGQAAPAPQTNDQSLILEAINSLTQKIDNVVTEVATMKAQTGNPAPVQNRIPVPRSIQTNQFVAQSQVATNPNSVTNIVRRSVSSYLPPK